MALPPLSQDVRDLLRSLNSARIEYLVIGGYAVSHYGYVRYTHDFDVWVAVSPLNVHRLKKALRSFGYDSLPEPLFQPPRTTLRMGHPPYRIEILSKISGVTFSTCYKRRVMVDADGMKVPVIELRDLLRNKKASGRPKDVGDVGELEKARTRLQPKKRSNRRPPT
jgi:predicted nucleotidyltransferase